MKILFVPQAGSLGIGGTTRCLAVAQEANIWGHEIAFLSKPILCKLAKNLDYKYFDAVAPHKPKKIDIVPYKLADHIKIRGMDDPSYLDQAVKHELSIYKEFNPDIVFTEYQFTTAISCHLAGIPLLSTVSWHTHPNFSANHLGLISGSFDVENNYNKILRKYGLSEIDNISNLLINSSTLNIAPTIPELEPQLKNLPNIFYVGPLLYPGIELKEINLENLSKNNRNIYVYMSNGDLKPNIYIPELIKAFDMKPFSVFVSLVGGKYNGYKLPIQYKNIYIRKMLPGMSMARRSCVVITRGGQNTMMSCLLAGVPVIGFPGNNAEPDYNVSSIQKFGAAMNCKVSDFKSEKIIEFVMSVIENSSMKKAALDLGNKIRDYQGASSVCAWLHNHL